MGEKAFGVGTAAPGCPPRAGKGACPYIKQNGKQARALNKREKQSWRLTADSITLQIRRKQ
jgi:hypothetical protein